MSRPASSVSRLSSSGSRPFSSSSAVPVRSSIAAKDAVSSMATSPPRNHSLDPSSLASLVVAGSGLQIRARNPVTSPLPAHQPPAPSSPATATLPAFESLWSFNQGKKSASPKKSSKDSASRRKSAARQHSALSLSGPSSPASRPSSSSSAASAHRSSVVPDIHLQVTGQSLSNSFDMTSLRRAAHGIPMTPDSGISSQISDSAASPFASLSLASSPAWSPASERRDSSMAFGDESDNRPVALKKPRVDSGATCFFERMVKSCSSEALEVNPLGADIKMAEESICIPRPRSAPSSRAPSFFNTAGSSKSAVSVFTASASSAAGAGGLSLMARGTSAFSHTRSTPSRQSFLVHREEVSFSPITTSESEMMEEQ